MAGRCCSGAPTPPTPPGSTGSGPRCWPRAASGSGRGATTRWSRRGTGWPSRRWPRPGCCSASRPSSTGPGGRRSCWPGCTSRPGGWPGRRGTAWPSGSAGVLEDYACVAEGLLTLSGVTGEAALAVAGRGAAGHRAGAVRRRDRRLLRHRRRRGGAGLPARGSRGRPHPVGGLRGGRRAAQLLRAHRVDAPPGGRGGRAGAAPADRGAVPAGRRVGPGRRRGADLRARRDRGRAARRTTRARPGCTSPRCRPPRRARLSRSGTAGSRADGGPGDTAARRARAWSAGPRPPTCAAASPASPRSPSRRRCAPRCRRSARAELSARGLSLGPRWPGLGGAGARG